MSASPNPAAELGELLAALREDAISDAQAGRLTAILRDDPAARRVYIHQMALVANLLESLGGLHPSSFIPPPSASVAAAVEPFVSAAVELPHQLDAASPEPLIPPIIIDSSATIHYPLFSIHSPLGGWLISYGTATVIMGAAILGAWLYKVSFEGQLAGAVAAADNSRRPAAAGEPVPGAVSSRLEAPQPVGRITGAADCRWAGPQAAPSAAVSLGQRYDLASGLMEIAYDSGAKVILEGPCAYEVESPAGGFLSLGKLTARVEKLSAISGQQSEILNPKSQISKFVVRTPTAIVTDLGTEFGVEVSEKGDTRSHVFQGKIEVRLVGGDNPAGRTIQLGAGQSARVTRIAGGVAVVRRGAVARGVFARQLPRRIRMKLFNTGAGLKEGDEDPHWQLVARSDEPNLRPQHAVVTSLADNPQWYLENDPAGSQWISTAGNRPNLPVAVTYTFSTRFELPGLLPGQAVLRGWFIADDFVRDIRLNGAPVPIPRQPDMGPFVAFYGFTATKGFVEGTNTLDIDVRNGYPSDAPSSPPNPMLLRVELEGSFVGGDRSDATVAATPSPRRSSEPSTPNAAAGPKKGDERMNGP